MINHKFISFSSVQIYDLSYIHLHAHDYHAQSCTLEKPDDFPQNKQTNNFTKRQQPRHRLCQYKNICEVHQELVRLIGLNRQRCIASSPNFNLVPRVLSLPPSRKYFLEGGRERTPVTRLTQFYPCKFIPCASVSKLVLVQDGRGFDLYENEP